MSFFDEINDDRPDESKLKPYHTVKDKDDKNVLEWLTKAIESLQKQAVPRNAKARRNLEAYRGSTSNIKRTDLRRSERQFLNKVNKFVVNHLYDMTETRISQMTRLKPAVQVVPTNDEFEDRNTAKAVKHLIDHLWYINDMETIQQKMLRNTFIFGESYCFIEWDKDKGDLHPTYVMARDQGIPLNQVDKEGNPVLDDKNKPILIDPDKPVRIGDVSYSIELPWRVFLQRKSQYEDVEYLFRIKTAPVEDLKKKYPKLSEKIKATTNVKKFDADSLSDHLLEEEVVCYEFFHKQTKFCQKGARILFTDDVILESEELPYSHGDLPIVRLTDMDIPEQLNGISVYEMATPIQNMHDNISTLIAKNIYLMGHAKWVMPRGACKIESLGNDNTIVQYQGPVPPQMMQVQPNPPEAYGFRDALRNELGQIYGIQGVSRGTPPKGITAAVALQFLNEKEQERANTMVIKHNNMVKQIAKKTIAVAGDYYDPDDGRMVRIVGENNKYSIRHFDSASLSKDYDVRLELGTGLPESKAGKVQRIVEIMQMKPDLLSNERWIDLLDLGNTEKMNSLITVAIRASESENEDIMAGRPVEEPKDYEDHIAHWKVHVKAIQERTFKEECLPEYRRELLEHLAIHEFLMIQKAQTSPAFEAQLATLASFPVFPSGYVPRSAQQQEVTVQGQANRGEPITGQIPAEDKTNVLEQDIKGEY